MKNRKDAESCSVVSQIANSVDSSFFRFVVTFLSPVGGFVFGAIALSYLAPIPGAVQSVVIAPEMIPLRTAGATPVVAIAYVGIELVRIYLTGFPVLIVGVGSVIAVTQRRGVVFGIFFGILAAGMLTLLSGCHCGTGSTIYLWQAVINAVLFT